MMKITDIQLALEIFEEACVLHIEATKNGDYKTGNKCHSRIMQAIAFLKSENAIGNLKDYLSHPDVGVRLWSASFWLPIDEEEGINILQDISNGSGIISLMAETTIQEWKKGNLKF